MPKVLPRLALQAADREEIERWVRAHSTPQQVMLRSHIVLAAADGQSDSAIAQALAVNRKTGTLWRARYATEGLESVWDVAPGRGRKPRYGPEKIQQIVEATLQTTPPGMTHWSCRLMAQRLGVSKSTISNVWRSHNLKPHLSKTFKLSRDPRFLEKLTDVVGLYLNPPQHALVLCVDEKSQIQALDRTQPGLPLKKGRCGTMTHDYKRVYPGFPTLFWGLSVFFVGDLMGKALWKLVENAARFPRRGGRVLCVHGAVSFHRARPCGPRWLPGRGAMRHVELDRRVLGLESTGE